MLSCLCPSMEEDTIWKYDPRRIISKLIIVEGLGPYQHDSKSQIERLKNIDKWEEVPTTENIESSKGFSKAASEVIQTKKPKKSVLEMFEQQHVGNAILEVARQHQVQDQTRENIHKPLDSDQVTT